MKLARQQFEDGNRAATEVILSNPKKFGGERALMVRWARLFLDGARKQRNPTQPAPIAVCCNAAAQAEHYNLDCARCGRAVELPTGNPSLIERPRYTRCGDALEIDWRCTSAPAAKDA